MILLFTSVGLWRQQLRPTPRVHGIIREGGTAANIIPDRTVGLVHDPERRPGRLRADARRASASCARRPPWRPTRPSRSRSPAAPGRCATTGVLAERFRANMAAYGIADQGDDPNAGSTDMANVSWVCPTIHPDLAIAPEGTPGHSILFRDAAATPAGRRDDAPRGHARRPDRLELFAIPALVAAAWAEFRATDEPDLPTRLLPSRWRAPLDDWFRTGGAPSETDPDRGACRRRDRLRRNLRG